MHEWDPVDYQVSCQELVLPSVDLSIQVIAFHKEFVKGYRWLKDWKGLKIVDEASKGLPA